MDKTGAVPFERVLYFLLHKAGGSGSLSSASGGLLSTYILVGTDEDSPVAVGIDENSPVAVGMDENSPVAGGIDENSPVAVGMDEASLPAAGVQK